MMSQEESKHVAIIYKSKLHIRTGNEDQEGMRYKGLLFFILSAKFGGWSKPRPGRFTPGRDLVLIV